MPSPAIHARRRARLAERVSKPVLLLGNGERARNLPMNKVRFRQDSSFLYFVGCDRPDAAAILHGGTCTLYLPPPAHDDALWHGHVESFAALQERYGVDAVRPISELEPAVRKLQPLTLAVGDEAKNRAASAWLRRPLEFGVAYGDDALVDAVIALRRPKDPDELDQMRLAAVHTAAAHVAVMRGTYPGGHETRLTALFEGVLAARGCSTGYDTILSQSGEILHNRDHSQSLEAGRLVLLDGGGELPSGYGSDVTRAWPVSGRFTPRQKAAYEAVLAAQLAAIDQVRPGVRYRAVHDTACLVLARWLVDEKLLRCSPEVAVELGAHAVFFPHGTGHLIGLDVHDLENFGDRPSYPKGQGRPEPFGTRYLRMDLPLEAGWVVTVEPGFYVVPAILADSGLRATLGDAVDWERAATWLGFGGIRIEDDVVCTPTTGVARGLAEVLTAAIPKTVAAIEATVGTGPSPEELLWYRPA
jgi:Xaa-Pro aminopeptidase